MLIAVRGAIYLDMANIKEECVKAIAAHAAWKFTFKQLISGEAKVDAATTRMHDRCDFGKWLAASGTRADLGADFEAINTAHKQFHSAAADVVEAHNRGQNDKVNENLSMTGAFSVAGANLTRLVATARDKAH